MQDDDNKPTWSFKSDEIQKTTAGNRSNKEVDTSEAISWTASEFIEHSKDAGWYFMLVAITVLVSGAVYLFTRGDLVSTTVVPIVAILFGVFASRKPRELEYIINGKGIKISGKMYPYSDFRTFSVVVEEGVDSIVFTPFKRYMPTLSIYFAPKDGEKIANLLSKHLPHESRKLDAVDRFMHRIRF